MTEEKIRPGYTWVETKSGGYWSKINNRARHSHKLPFFCPYENCIKKITGTIDDEYILKYGICKTCYVLYIEDRKTPLLDLEFYAKRFKERGY